MSTVKKSTAITRPRRLAADRITRSAVRNAGRRTWRRRTANWWRRTALWIMVPLVAAATAGLYACALSMVYLSTPYDLEFHLTTSATRTLAPAMTAFAISIALFAKGFEDYDHV